MRRIGVECHILGFLARTDDSVAGSKRDAQQRCLDVEFLEDLLAAIEAVAR